MKPLLKTKTQIEDFGIYQEQKNISPSCLQEYTSQTWETSKSLQLLTFFYLINVICLNCYASHTDNLQKILPKSNWLNMNWRDAVSLDL